MLPPCCRRSPSRPAEEETSKTLFYLLGGLLAVWAVVLFVVGMRSPSFPGVVRRDARA